MTLSRLSFSAAVVGLALLLAAFGGPPGPPGKDGEKGEPGPAGPPGRDAPRIYVRSVTGGNEARAHCDDGDTLIGAYCQGSRGHQIKPRPDKQDEWMLICSGDAASDPARAFVSCQPR